jgi:hypothetical protein
MAPSDGRLRLLRLVSELDRERRAISRVVAEAAEAVALAGTRPLSSLEARGAADLLHDFYTGVEKSLELIAVSMDGGLPEGPHWHRRLLRCMSEAVPGVRPPVLGEATAADLDAYLRFRHVFRSLYGFELSWERLAPLLDDLARVSANLLRDLEVFQALVRDLADAG